MKKKINKPVVITLRISQDDKDEIVRRAELNNMNMTEFMLYASLKTKIITATYEEK